MECKLSNLFMRSKILESIIQEVVMQEPEILLIPAQDKRQLGSAYLEYEAGHLEVGLLAQLLQAKRLIPQQL